MRKIEEAILIIKQLGFPAAQQNKRSAICLLALLNLSSDKDWEDAESPLLGITSIMNFAKENYGQNYSPNTRETFRRQTLHQFVSGGLALYNPDDPNRPVNSPKVVYQIEPNALALIKRFAKNDWKAKLKEYVAERGPIDIQGTKQKKGIAFRNESRQIRKAKEGKSFFFGIGIDEYQYFTNLNNAAKDVKDLVALLQEQYDLKAENTWLLFNKEATYRNIIHKLEELVKVIKGIDKLLIYYSGHGHLNDRNRGFWIPSDAEKGIPDKYIRNSTIRDYIKDFPAKHTLLISDSCFSGTLFVRGANRSTTALEELERKVSRWALCSGRHDEEVYDGEPGRNSPFAESILEVLNGNQEPKFNVAKLADRVMELTRANYEQLPEGNPIYGVGHKGGQYIFCRKQKLFYEDFGEDDLWNQCSAENTIEALSKYLGQYPNGRFADEAIEKIKKCEQDDEAWEKAKKVDRISSYYEYISRFPDGLYMKEAKIRIEKLEQTKAASRIVHKTKIESPITSDRTGVSKNKNEYYADLAKLPHQKGKWAVFKDGTQIQGTVKKTEEEAQSLADGLNNKTSERLTLSNGAYVIENGMPFFETDRLPSWKYYDEKEGVEGVVLVYLFSMDEIKVVKPDTWNLPKETIDNIESEVNREKVQLLKMHGIDR